LLHVLHVEQTVSRWFGARSKKKVVIRKKVLVVSARQVWVVVEVHGREDVVVQGTVYLNRIFEVRQFVVSVELIIALRKTPRQIVEKSL
jgi:hypothetical protein